MTHFDWYQFLAARPDIDEVNFWQPSGAVGFKALEPGGLFLLKLHSPRNFIVGEAVLAHWSSLPVSLAWEAFGPKHGEKDGPHEPQNGLLLRSDVHTLFDRGYVTVTPELRFLVGKRIREEFENGRDYYALHGSEVQLPVKRELAPSREYLDWHASNVPTARDKSIVLDSLEKHLGHEPLVETRNRKQLRPNPIAPRELRLGRVRVYFEVEQEPRRVVRIVAVGFKDRSKVWIGGAAVELK